MKNKIISIGWLLVLLASLTACAKKSGNRQTVVPPIDTGLVNLAHLNNLYVPVSFPDGMPAAGVYIYSQYPDYHPVEASGEGFTCVDDVSRAALVYLRSNSYSSDTAKKSKLYHLIRFILEMQSSNSYFYNFLFANNLINTGGVTSSNNPNWWSWRALQALAESAPIIKNDNASLYNDVQTAIANLISHIKINLAGLPLTTTVVSGVTIPQWLPSESATDQSATMLLGLIDYCNANQDTAIVSYIKKLADGIVLMQQGDATHFPYSAFLSWENTWHAYGNTQAYALMRAGTFLNNPQYNAAALAEVDNFYPWLLQNGLKSSFTVSNTAGTFQILAQSDFDQIAYGIEPMVFAATEAYKETGQDKYADLAGHLAAWLLGSNVASTVMYSTSTGICFDGISSASSVNFNSGAESTIEALLTMELVEANPAIKAAMNKYKKP